MKHHFPKEKDFLQQRLHKIEAKLGSPDPYDRDDQGHLHFRLQPSPVVEERLVHEEHLLKKFLNEVEEGEVLQALVSWRKDLGRQWKEYKELFRFLLDAHDHWARLPWQARSITPEPPQLPDLEIEDQHGLIWVIDERFLQVMDDLIERLSKWMNCEDA